MCGLTGASGMEIACGLMDGLEVECGLLEMRGLGDGLEVVHKM